MNEPQQFSLCIISSLSALKSRLSLQGQTAFQLACIHGHTEIAEMLMENSTKLNIKINSKDEKGKILSGSSIFRL